jgi:hypothetical protein
MTLAEALRGPLSLTGTKIACDRGACSACTRYTVSGQTTSLIDHLRGPNKTRCRLGPELERIIDAAIQTHYLVRPRKPMESVYKEVKRRCHAENRVTPSRNSVLKRICALDARLVARCALPTTESSSILGGNVVRSRIAPSAYPIANRDGHSGN